MYLNSSWSSAIHTNFPYDFPVHFFRLSIHVVLCLPLLHLPLIFPSSSWCCNKFCLTMWPKYWHIHLTMIDKLIEEWKSKAYVNFLLKFFCFCYDISYDLFWRFYCLHFYTFSKMHFYSFLLVKNLFFELFSCWNLRNFCLLKGDKIKEFLLNLRHLRIFIGIWNIVVIIFMFMYVFWVQWCCCFKSYSLIG